MSERNAIGYKRNLFPLPQLDTPLPITDESDFWDDYTLVVDKETIKFPKDNEKNREEKTFPPDEVDLDLIHVECICPKCGVRHVMNFPWTGRGQPRKFCPKCRID